MVSAAAESSILPPSRSEGDPVRPPLADARRQVLLDRVVDLLLQKAVARCHWPELYHEASRLLRSATLGPVEWRAAIQRLRNAESYAVAGEFGAAAFELRLLHGRLP